MTITAAAARDALTARLGALHPNLIVYTGTVPEKVPTWGTQIRPYVGLWVSNNVDDPWGRSLTGRSDTGDAVRLRIQTQIVAADEPTVYEVADLITGALTNHLIGGHPVLPDPDQQANAYVLTDRSVTPSRPYLPLMWGLTTQ